MDLTTPQSSTLRLRSRRQINSNSNTDTGDTDSLDFVWLGGCVPIEDDTSCMKEAKYIFCRVIQLVIVAKTAVA